MSYFDPLSDEDKIVVERIKDEFFKNSSIILSLDKKDPQWIDDSGRVFVGVWGGGPIAKSSNVLHEMAHFVEIDDRRIAKDNWGLKFPNQRWVSCRYGFSTWCEPETMQMSARELRVLAFQHHLHDYLGIETWRDKAPRLIELMPDFYLVPGSSIEARKRWISSMYDRLIKSQKYSLKNFISEWNRKNKILAEKYKRTKPRKKKLFSPIHVL